MPADIGRLALRVEGENWVAYYALRETMDGALFLGSIRMALVVKNPARKEAFMQIMQDAIAEIIKDTTGADLGWNNPQRAPEHERSGRA